MNKKILFVATVQSHICQFHLPIMEMLKEEGFEVHVAARDNLAEKNGLKMKYADEIYNIPFERSPFNKKNIQAYKELKNILLKEDYDIVHCNTPVGGIVARLAARKFRKGGLRVIYTAHGFHFYKGAPVKNWLIYYPIEKIMAHLTDDLITITKEDYNLANKKKFKCNVHHIYGVGVNSNKFKQVSIEEKNKIREKKGYKKDEFIILCTGELNKNKNQSTVIQSMSYVVKYHPNTKLLLAGNGPTHDELEKLIKSLGLESNIELLGYRTDLEEYVNLCDLVVSASYREGMPLNIMEAMICGKPVIASDNRGHRELIYSRKNGILIDGDEKNFSKEIIYLIINSKIRQKYGEKSLDIIKPYDIKNIKNKLSTIYTQI